MDKHRKKMALVEQKFSSRKHILFASALSNLFGNENGENAESKISVGR